MTNYLSDKLTILYTVLIIMVIYINGTYLEIENYALVKFLQRFIGLGICHIANCLFFCLSGYMFAYSIKTEIVLPNGKVLVNHLKSRFNDNEINSDTATIAVYAEYNNKDNLLIPGNYVDIRLGNKEDKMAILVPQASVAQDKHGNYVMVVGDDNIAYERRVVMGDTLEDKQIVLDGLKADERVIIQGLQKVSNGQKVQVGEIANNSEKVTVEGK